MAITDGLICQIYPVAGETAIKNIVDGTMFTGTGTPTLVDEAAEKAWSVVAGTLVESAIPSKLPSGNVAGSGVTIAIRFKPTANGSGADFLSILGVKPDSTSVDPGVRITRSGNGAFRGRSEYQLTTSLTGFNLNTVYTLVYKIEINPVAASDFGKLWRNTVGRVGTDADASSAAADYAINRTLNRAFVNCQSGVAYTLLDFAYWDRELTDEECASVADNYRGVMPAPSSGTTPIAFTGTIPAQTFTNGQAVSVNLASYFTGTQTPFTFANTGAALTGTGLSISSAGLLTGTATTGSVTGVIVTGTDADTNTAASNAFNVTVNAASVPVSFGGTIPAITGTQNAAITPVNTSTYFSGNLTPFTYSLFSGSLPSGVTLNSSTGVISGTPTVSFSGNIVVRATDTGSNVSNSNSIAVTIAAAAGTITITDVVNNTNTPWASAAVDAATVMPLNLGSVVVNKAGLSTTAGADLVITDASIVTGTEYIILIKIGSAYGWYRAVAS